MRQSFTGMKNGGETAFEINNAIATEVFSLFISDPLQRLLGLRNRNGVRETLQIFGQTAFIRALVEPVG